MEESVFSHQFLWDAFSQTDFTFIRGSLSLFLWQQQNTTLLNKAEVLIVARLKRYEAQLPPHLAPLRVSLFEISEMEIYFVRTNFIFYTINLCLKLVLMRLKCSDCMSLCVR